MSEITHQPLYLIKFDDTEVPDETMFGAEIASKRFKQVSGNWNAHLFVKLASNSRDDVCSGSNARSASDYDALAAQRDEGLARVAELEDALDECDGDRHRLRDKAAFLQQRLAEAEKDAARYRWLRDRPLDGSEPFWIAVSSDDVYKTRCWALGGSSPDTCDQAIDKAMSSAGPADQEQQS